MNAKATWSNKLMPVQFESIAKGSKWDRNRLAELWGYRSFHALARGVFTPANRNLVVLFVTEEKQNSLTQYDDRLDGGVLHWEGEDGHQNDARIARAKTSGDEIHLFYRERHHGLFEYYGKLKVNSFKIFTDQPSQFVFELLQ